MYIIPKPPLLVVAYMRLAFDQNVRDIYGLKNAGRGLHFSAFIVWVLTIRIKLLKSNWVLIFMGCLFSMGAYYPDSSWHPSIMLCCPSLVLIFQLTVRLHKVY